MYIEEKKLFAFLQSDDYQIINTLYFSNSLGNPLIISLHKSTFQNLQNNNIGILSNNELRKYISRFYDFFHNSVITIENQYPAYQTYAGKKPFFQKYFKLSGEIMTVTNEKSNNEEYFNPDYTTQAMEIIHIKGAKSDEGFKIELNESLLFRTLKIGVYENMLNITRELNKMIEIELSNLEN